jgi:hypothetical protein
MGIAKRCPRGFMPGSSKGSLHSQWIFGLRSEQREPLARVGRNVRCDDKYAKWTADCGREAKENDQPHMETGRLN